jgi:hypothetical protein
MERTFYLLQYNEDPEKENPKPLDYVDKSFSELPIRLQQRFLTSLRAKIEKITNEEIDKVIAKKNQDLISKYDKIMQIRNKTRT